MFINILFVHIEVASIIRDSIVTQFKKIVIPQIQNFKKVLLEEALTKLEVTMEIHHLEVDIIKGIIIVVVVLEEVPHII